MNSGFGAVSLPTKRSMRSSLLMSAVTTPQALASEAAMPDSRLTFVKVPSPLLWNSQLGIGW